MTDEDRAGLPIPVRENIVRALPGVGLRSEGEKASDGRLGTLFGRLANYDQWAEVRSPIEGHFMERTMAGAFKKTFSENRSRMQVIFDHGQDQGIGRKPLGPLEDLDDRADGIDYTAALIDANYNRDLLPGLRAGLYGNSYRFSVPRNGDVWAYHPARSEYNPEGIPERTIREAKIIELGPTPFPVYGGTFSGVRSLTDEYLLRQLTSDPERLETLIRSIEPPESPALPADGAEADPHSDDGEPPPTDAPQEAEPSPDAPAPTPEDPPEGGSLDSQETTPVTDNEFRSVEDKAARLTELEASIKRQTEEVTGTRSVEEQASWDADKAEFLALSADLATVAEARSFLADHVEHPTRTESPMPNIIRAKSVEDIYDIRSLDFSPISPEQRSQKLRDNAMRSIETSTFPKNADLDSLSYFLDNSDSGEERDQEAARRILVTGSPSYKRAFTKYLKTGDDRLFTAEEETSWRAAALAVVGTTTTGGYMVPYVLDPTLIHIGAHTAINPYRAACRVETISGGNNWRAVTATAIVAKWDTEAAASVEGGPTIGQPTFTAQRADAFVTVSIETLQDRPDITGELSSLFAEAKDNLEENSFTLGAGTTVYPQGMFLSGAFTVVSTATNDVTAIADILLLEAALPLRHRMNAAWFMSRSTMRQLEALDTTGYYFKRPGQFYAAGSAIPQNSPTGNTGTQLLGYPVWEVPSAVSTLTTDAAVIAVFGDPKSYVILDRIGLNVEVVPTMLNGATPSFPTGQRGIYAYWRGTARALNVDGMRQLDVN